MPDKSDEILLAIATLKSEMKEQIAAVAKRIQDTVSAAVSTSPGREPSQPTPAPSVQQVVLARDLKQYCADTAHELEAMLAQAKEKNQDVPATQRLISRLREHATSTAEDLAGKGALYLRTEIERLQTTVNLVKRSVTGPKSTTAAIPFPNPEGQEPETHIARKTGPASANKRVTLHASEQTRPSSSAGKDKRALAASAKAS